MLQRIDFTTGAGSGCDPLTIDATPSITIFVGPNNSGKSQALQDIAAILTSGQTKSKVPVIRGLHFAEIGQGAASAYLDLTTVSISDRNGLEHRLLKAPNGDMFEVDTNSFQGCLLNPNNPSYRNLFSTWYASKRFLSLAGSSRMNLIDSQPWGDLKNPNNPMTRLFVNDEKRERVRQIVFDALGLHLALDCTQDQRISARFSKTPPPNERNITDELLDYMRSAQSHDKVSDGVKAFVGILLQVHAGEPDIVLIDEPEAFLHPALAYTLGREIASGASSGGKFVFAATHSPHFLMGAVASGAKVNVVRLTYDGDEGTARMLPNDELVRMMRNPLLRSVGVLEGLFHAHIVVTEADADRAFYQEINHRLLTSGDARAIPHALFLNANGIHTIPRITAPLRKLGIPAAQIVDVDFVGLTGSQADEQLEAAFVPKSEKHTYRLRMQSTCATLRNACGAAPDRGSANEKQSFKTLGGLRLLRGQELEAAENLLQDLARYGVFVVPHGEVENWLEALDMERTKEKWLRKIFEKMGDDPEKADYVRPQNGDAWDFIGKIKAWMVERARRGTG